MIITEKQASGMWCPLARTWGMASDTVTTVNRDDRGLPDMSTFCMGSKCMAWRNGPAHMSSNNQDDGKLGYCGAFGKADT